MEKILVEIIESVIRYLYTFWFILIGIKSDELYLTKPETKDKFTNPVVFLLIATLLYVIFHDNFFDADFKAIFDKSIFSNLSFDGIIRKTLYPSAICIITSYLISRILFNKSENLLVFKFILYLTAFQFLCFPISYSIFNPFIFLVKGAYNLNEQQIAWVVVISMIPVVSLVLFSFIYPFIFAFITIKRKYTKNIFYKFLIVAFVFPVNAYLILSTAYGFFQEKVVYNYVEPSITFVSFETNNSTTLQYKKIQDSIQINLKIGITPINYVDENDLLYISKNEKFKLYLTGDLKEDTAIAAQIYNIGQSLKDSILLFKIVNWSDGNSPIMTLEKNKVKWLELTTRIDSSQFANITNFFKGAFPGFIELFYGKVYSDDGFRGSLVKKWFEFHQE